MLDVVLFVARRDVTPPQRHTTVDTYEIQAAKVIPLAKRLLLAVGAVDGEKLACNDISAIHAFKAIQMEYCA